jgi:hypothetical protein
LLFCLPRINAALTTNTILPSLKYGQIKKYFT